MTGTGHPDGFSGQGDAERRLAALLRTGPLVLYSAGATEPRTMWVSQNVYAVGGFPPERFLEDPALWADRLHPEDRDRVLQEVLSLRQRDSLSMEYRWQCADGSYRWFLDRAALVRDAAGRPLEVVGTWLDITERKRAEEEVRQARDEAERAARARTEFLSRASHELRTPLNAILGFAQLLEMERLTPPQRENVAEILKGGRRLLDLVDEVLDIARIDAGRLHLSIEAVDVGEALRETLDLMRPLAAQRAVRLPRAVEACRARHVAADDRRFKQVLLNLLSNAILYNREGGSVDIWCGTGEPASWRVAVRDTGPGIHPDMLPRLFTPFDRLGADDTGVEGSGLGLALSKRLVEAMGGTLGVDTHVGEGSTFWVQLPAADSPADALDRWRDAGEGLALLPPGSFTILYIEDNLANLKLIERLVLGRSGVKVLAAMQGGLGLLLAREHRPDLVLLDVHLPDMPGEEVLGRLGGRAETRGIPVVVLSSDDCPHRRQRLLAAGARAFLSKPLDVAKFVGVVAEALGGGGRG